MKPAAPVMRMRMVSRDFAWLLRVAPGECSSQLGMRRMGSAWKGS